MTGEGIAVRKAPPRGLGVARIQPAYEQVAGQLRHLIQTGSITVGEQLPVETQLAAAFGVSRSTVREALRTLSSQGLVHTTRGPTGGTFVSAPDDERLQQSIEAHLGLLRGTARLTDGDYFDAREMIEVPCARLAADRRTPEHLEEMREAISRERTAVAAWERGAHSHDFHAAVVRATGNTLLQLVTTPIFRSMRTRTLARPGRETWHELDQAHDQILQSIQDQDGASAARAMLAHIEHMRASGGSQ